MKKDNGTRRKKDFLFIIIGLVVALLLLESFLRLAGFIYKTYRINNKAIAGGNKDAIKILCLGDSFTFGVGAESGNDYPSQLEQLLNKNYQNKKFIVYNGGIPGQNSSMVLKRLLPNIKTYSPDIIILLVGSNNRTILEDSNYYFVQKNRNGKTGSFFLRSDIILSKSRTYKLIRMAILNLVSGLKPGGYFSWAHLGSKAGKIEGKPNEESGKEAGDKEDCLKLINTLCNERKLSEAENIIKEKPPGYNLSAKTECLLLSNIYCEQGNYDLALSILEAYIQSNPGDPSVLSNLGRIYYMRGRIASLTKEDDFMRSSKALQESLLYVDSNDLSLKGEIYINLAQLYSDKGEAELARKMATQALEYSPGNQFFKQISVKILEQSLSDEENEIFNKLLYYDLGKIINLCRLHNIEIILLNYPREGRGGIRKEIADKYNVPFIDIASNFTKLLSQYKYDDLFLADEHPNTIGYKIMAEVILEGLKHETGAL